MTTDTVLEVGLHELVGFGLDIYQGKFRFCRQRKRDFKLIVSSFNIDIV